MMMINTCKHQHQHHNHKTRMCLPVLPFPPAAEYKHPSSLPFSRPTTHQRKRQHLQQTFTCYDQQIKDPILVKWHSQLTIRSTSKNWRKVVFCHWWLPLPASPPVWKQAVYFSREHTSPTSRNCTNAWQQATHGSLCQNGSALQPVSPRWGNCWHNKRQTSQKHYEYLHKKKKQWTSDTGKYKLKEY